MNTTEIDSILSKSAENRAGYLFEQANANKEIWILIDDVGAVMFQSDDEDCLPVWPSKDIAQLWCDGDWEHCKPHAISLEKWEEKWTPGLEDDEVAVLVFPNAQDEGVVMLPWEFQEKLN